MNHYPVLIPTLNRYEHFRRCVESLSRCTHAEETELVIGLDYPPSEKYREGYEKIKAYIPQITGFKKVTCIKREYNYGAVNNSTDLTSRYFKIYDAIIFSEDDIEFAPCFLDFMDKALDMYKDEPKVRSVCGYVPEYLYRNLSLSTIFINPHSSAWGIGLWRDKEKEFRLIPYEYYLNVLKSFKSSMKILVTYPRELGLLQYMVTRKLVWGDVMRSIPQLLNGTFQVRPSMSLTRNWGYDGSGLNCGSDMRMAEKYTRQPIVESATYPIELQKVEKTKGLFWSLYFDAGNTPLIAIKRTIGIFLRYLKFRLL